MAQYPTSVFSKADIANGATSDATDVNDLAHEITAITDGLLNGTARVNSSNTTVQTFSAAGGSTFSTIVMGPGQPRCGVFHSGTQSISSASTTALTFDSEDYDVGGLHSTSASPSRLTVPVGSSGVFMVTGQTLLTQVTANAALRIYLRKNGADVQTVQSVQPSTAVAVTVGVSALLTLNGADFVELAVASGADPVTAGSAVAPFASRLALAKVW